jgi:ribosome maturation factor RimP
LEEKGDFLMKAGVKDKVREVIEPTVNQLGYRIWDVTYQKIGADFHLEITIDSDNGINIDDCEKVHRAIDPILDEYDFIENFYYLEVSSPGIEREIRTEEHIRLSLGATVEVKLFAAKDGKKAFVATLESYDNGVVTFAFDGEHIAIPENEISKMTTVFFE